MISAPNYVYVYITSQLSYIFLIKDKLSERKTDIPPQSTWERGNDGSQQTRVPCEAACPALHSRRSLCQDGC